MVFAAPGHRRDKVAMKDRKSFAGQRIYMATSIHNVSLFKEIT
jgi:hypothetical protein